MNSYFNLRKRGLALFVALMMCLSLLPGQALAADKGELCPKCHDQVISYSKENESQHRAYCTWCNKYDELELHTFVNGFCAKCGEADPSTKECTHEKTFIRDDKNGKTHSVYCTGCEKLVSTVSHSYTNGKCDCGAQEPVHEHSWKYTPDYYQVYTHVKTCTSCGEKVTEPCTTTVTYDPWEAQYVKKCTLCNYWSYPVADQHNWSEWKSNEDGTHTHTCTDLGCTETGTEECKLEAIDNAAVKCSVCGYVKYNDGTPGDGGKDECPDGKHEYGNIGTPAGEGSHTLKCLNCGATKTEVCSWEILKENDQPVAHYCRICGNQKSIRNDGDQYCSNTDDGHDWSIVKEVLSEDGTAVITTLKCAKCPLTKVQEICTSPTKVVVHYVYEDGKTAAPDASQAVIKGMEYSITSPTIEGYTPDVEVVSGTCEDGSGTVFTVTYKEAAKTLKYVVRWCDIDTGEEIGKKSEIREGTAGTIVKPNEADKVLNGYTYQKDASDENGFLLDSESVEIKLCFKKNLDLIPYTVEWQVNGETVQTETRHAYKGQKVGPSDKDKVWEGCTYLEHESDNEWQVINDEGTTHIKLVFNKNVVEPAEVTYTVTLYDAADNTVIKAMTRKADKVGADIHVDEGDKNVEGYTFLEGDPRNVETLKNIPAAGAELKLFFAKKSEETVNIKYTVTWIGAAQDGTETTLAVENREVTDMNATSVSVTDADKERTFDGFDGYVFDSENSHNILTVEDVKGQTNVELKLYYHIPAAPQPDLVTVTWLNGYDGGQVGDTAQVERGTASISQDLYPADPTREGYEFTGWTEPVTDDNGNITITATWDPVDEPDEPDEPTPPAPTDPVTPPPTIPDTPTPLDPGETISDQEVPLANTVGLNNADHFAYIIGYDDDTVRPLGNITRAEAVTIFFRLMTEEYRTANWSTENGFSDVNAGSWFNNAISTVQKAGALEHFAQDSAFLPNQAITRAEFASIAAGFVSDEITGENVGDFSDTEGHWAAEAIRKAVEAGWITGKSGNTFAPDETITRAEVMAIVNRMLDRTPDKDHMLPEMKKWTDNPESEWYYEDVQEATNEHDYERDEMSVEIWTLIKEHRDWAALETKWAANNGASESEA